MIGGIGTQAKAVAKNRPMAGIKSIGFHLEPLEDACHKHFKKLSGTLLTKQWPESCTPNTKRKRLKNSLQSAFVHTISGNPQLPGMPLVHTKRQSLCSKMAITPHPMSFLSLPLSN